MRGISKTFTGVRALRDVRLQAWGGEILALMGENGAGKSTLMKILSGAHRADPGGEILIDGKPLVINGPQDAKRAGIAIIYQELALAPNLSVAENIYLGSELRRPGWQVDRATMEARCAPILQRLGAPFGPRTLVGGLSIAEQQMVEIARALHGDSRILVLDEPTTALSSRETEHLFRLVRQLRAEGIALIYISHRMAEVYELADRVTVLRDGSYAGTLGRDQISAEAIVKMMVGRDLSSFYTKQHDPDTVHPHVVLEVDGVTDGGRRVKPCSFRLNRGEVLGLARGGGAGGAPPAPRGLGAAPPARPTPPHFAPHLAAPARHDPLLVQSQDRNGCLGGDAMHPSHQIPIDDDVADDHDPRHVHALAHNMCLENHPTGSSRRDPKRPFRSQSTRTHAAYGVQGPRRPADHHCVETSGSDAGRTISTTSPGCRAKSAEPVM